jgi:hypothetical protein
MTLCSTLGGVNAGGALQCQFTDEPFGKFSTTGTPPAAGFGNIYGMARIEYDPVGMYHANARYYHPTGRCNPRVDSFRQ